MDIEIAPTGPSEDEIRHRVQEEIQAAKALEEKALEEENNQIAREIEDEIRGMSYPVLSMQTVPLEFDPLCRAHRRRASKHICSPGVLGFRRALI